MWQADYLPDDPAKWYRAHVSGQWVAVTLTHGTKGAKLDGPAGVMGPPRTINLSVSLAEKLNHYRTLVRPRLLMLYIKSGTTKEEQAARRRNPPKNLFLSDYLGVPVTTHRLYEAWKSADPLPFPEWHPHYGRDYWACKTLLLELDRQLKATDAMLKAGGGVPVNWITGSAESVILTKIKPQLGHVDKKTTDIYLRWVVNAFNLVALHDVYAKELDDVCQQGETTA